MPGRVSPVSVLLIQIGVLLAALGLLLVGLGALLGLRGGKLLPGDLVVSRPGFTFVFPLATSILLSLLLTLALWALHAWRR
jgi:hypothetical protein